MENQTWVVTLEQWLVVKVGVSKSKTGERYIVTIPKKLVKTLGWSKGDYLVAKVVEVDVSGRRMKGILYYKLEA
jgi:bifunctional DNA-binding transcriptional regulator/antitoxin component of YhaV-PrlF toxin-antitoxin module